MPHPTIVKWLKDPEFAQLPAERKRQVVSRFYDSQGQEIADSWQKDPEFTKLPEARRAAIVARLQAERDSERDAFIAEQLGDVGATDDQRGFFSEAASGVGSGALAVEEALTGVAEMGINAVAPNTRLARAFGTARKAIGDARQSEALRRPEYLASETVLEHPERLADWRWWTRALGENLPNMAAMMLPGLGAMQGARALGAGSQTVAWAGRLGAFGGAAAVEAGNAYSEAKDDMTAVGLYPPEQIEAVARLEALTIGTVNGLLEVLPFDNLFLRSAGADKILKRIVRQGIVEGTTETAQEAVSVLVERMGHKPDQRLRDNLGRLLESGIIGGVMGGGAGAVLPGGRSQESGVQPAAAETTATASATEAEIEVEVEADTQPAPVASVPKPAQGAAAQPMAETGMAGAELAGVAAEAAAQANQAAARQQRVRAEAESLLDAVIREQMEEEAAAQVSEETPAATAQAPQGVSEQMPAAPQAEEQLAPAALTGGARVAPVRTVPSGAASIGAQPVPAAAPAPIETGAPVSDKVGPAPEPSGPVNQPLRPAAATITGKPSKRAKALAEYRAYVDGLSTEQRAAVSDLIEEAPAAPSAAKLKIQRALAKPDSAAPAPGTVELTVKSLATGKEETVTVPEKLPVKEPWQMTRKDYIASASIGRIEDDRALQRHKNSVTLAVNEGKAVPSEVLADYPELAKPSMPSGAVKEVGLNRDGKMVYENKDGNRMVNEAGFTRNAPRPLVSSGQVLKPWPSKKLFEQNRFEFLTKEKLESFKAEQKASETAAPQAPSLKISGQRKNLPGNDDLWYTVHKTKDAFTVTVGHHTDASVSRVYGEGDTAEAAYSSAVAQLRKDIRHKIEPASAGIATPSPAPGKAAAVQSLTGRPVEKPVFGAANKLVTADRAEVIKARLRAKLNQLSAGIDPELIALGTELAVHYIEGGMRSFGDFARVMVKDLGAKIKPYLRSFYEGARFYPGAEALAAGMSTAEQIATVDVDALDVLPKKTAAQTIGAKAQKKKPDVLTSAAAGVSGEAGQEVNDESIDTEAIKAPETGGAPDRITQPGPAVGAASAVADGQRAGADLGAVRAGSGPAGREAAEGPATGQLAADDTGTREQAGRISDRRAGQPDREPQRRPRADAGSGAGAVERQAKGTPAGLESQPAVEADRNHVIGADDEIVPPGDEAKIKANIAAIRLLKKLQAADRNPSPDEKKSLAKYVGWGAFAQKVFTRDFDAYLKRLATDKSLPAERYLYGSMLEKYTAWAARYGRHLHPALGGMLSEAEWNSARESTLNAHYTSREVISAMWALVERLGFGGGAVTEPAAGAGHFLGLMPPAIADRSALNAVELDTLTGAILEKLYPQARVQIMGFERARGIADNSQDLVISNFPFGKYAVHDPAHPQYKGWSIHNYFFGRSIDAVRPGGLVVGITSHYTLDAIDGRVRAELAQKADLVGAIRLPDTAFKKNAGTEVVTDIIVLRKKDGQSHGLGQDFRAAKSVAIGEAEAPVNEYFVAHPEMVLGRPAMSGSMYGADQYTVRPTGDLGAQLQAAIAAFPENIYGAGNAAPAPTAIRYADAAEREGVLLERDGAVLVVRDGRLETPMALNSKGEPVDVMADAAKARRVRGYLKVKAEALALIAQMQSETATDAQIAAGQAALTRAYDAFVKQNGEFGRTANGFLRQIDIEFAVVDALERELVQSIETRVKSGPQRGRPVSARVKTFSKSDIFTKRTIFPFKEPQSAESVADAYALAMIYRNRVDVGYIAELLATDEQSAQAQLLAEALVFVDPATGLLVPKDAYLSGNVRRKLELAERAAAEDPALAVNVTALRAVQPAALDVEFIYFKLGTSWVPPEAIGDFLQEVLGVTAQVRFARIGDLMSKWSLTVSAGSTGAANRQQWGTARRNGHALVEDCLNLKRAQVYDTFEENGSKRTVKNIEETEAAQAKQADLQAEFLRWGRAHATWGKKLADAFNAVANGHVLRTFEAPAVAHFPRANAQVSLRELQKRFVARGLVESTLFAHGVGTGKTFSFITLSQEMRRVGTAKKPLIVVQNSTVGQFRAAFGHLYPAARVLIPDDTQRSARYRQRVLSQMATGDWDAIVLPHSFFDGIADDPQREAAFVAEQVALIEEAITEAETDEGTFTVKDLEALKKRKLERLERLLERRKDSALTFEQLGIDALLIDEAHAYKRSEFFTKMGQVKGIDQGSSQRSTSLMLKAEYVRSKTGGKNVILATGTPISNTTAELWTMLRYVRPDLLEEYGVTLFDDFATTFGDTTISLEETESGTYKDVERFNRYVNGPELLTMFHMAADVQLTQTAGLNLPAIAGGAPEAVVVPRGPELTGFIAELRNRREHWENLSGREKRQSRHVPLVLFGLAKKAAVDLRLVNPQVFSDDPDSKLNRVVANVHEIWSATAEDSATQIVFLDIYQDRSGAFNAYEDMRAKLIARGIPPDEIAVVTDAKNDSAREAMFERVRTGQTRIIMGSTAKLGIGVNVQDRLIAAHHVDAPPRPMDIEQRNGRIVREGNRHSEVRIFNYGVKATLDSVMYDRLTKKQKFIDQMLTGDIEGRSFEDPLSDEQLSLAEQNAAFAGNPLVFEKATAEATAKKLRRAQGRHEREVSVARRTIAHLKEEIPRTQKTLAEAQARAALLAAQVPDGRLTAFALAGAELDRKGLREAISAQWQAYEEKIGAQYKGITRKEYAEKKEGTLDAETIVFDAHGLTMTLALVPTVYFGTSRAATTPGVFSGVSAAVAVGHKGQEILRRYVEKPAGLLSSLENSLAAVQAYPEKLQAQIDKLKQDLADNQGLAAAPFARAEELAAAEQRLEEVEAALRALTREQAVGPVDTAASAALDAVLGGGAESGPAQYALRGPGAVPVSEVTLADVQAVFKGQAAGVSAADPNVFWVRMKNGMGIEIRKVDHIDADRAALTLAYGRMDEKGQFAAGKYQAGRIELNRHLADRWTLAHENEHWLEDAGLLSRAEILAVRRHVIGLAAHGRWTPKNPADVGGVEDRASWVAEALSRRAAIKGLIGRIVQRIGDIIDALAHLLGRVTARAVVRAIESGSVFGRPGSGLSGETAARFAMVATAPHGGPPVTRDIEADRTFANHLHEMADQARNAVSVQTARLQERVQSMAGPASRKRFSLGLGYRKIKESLDSRILDQALFFYRDLGGDLAQVDHYRAQIAQKLADPALAGEQKIYLGRVLRALDKTRSLTDAQKAFADEMGSRFEAAYTIAQKYKVIQSHVDNYVRRIYKRKKAEPAGAVYSGWSGPGHSFKVAHGAAMQRKYATALDAVLDGYELGVSGITSAYDSYMQELSTVLANRAFIQRGVATKDVAGRSLFTTNTNRRPGYEDYKELKAPGFSVWQLTGTITAKDEAGLGGVLETNSWGKKVFITQPAQVPETWAVYASDTAARAARVFFDQAEAVQWAAEKQYGRIEHRPALETASQFQKLKLYAPAPLADMLNKMTASEPLFAQTPALSALLRFNAGIKSWILMSSFFHHLAGTRSWVFGVHHGWGRGGHVVLDKDGARMLGEFSDLAAARAAAQAQGGQVVEKVTAAPWRAYKNGLDKVHDLHPLVSLGVKNGLTLGEMQDWAEGPLRDQPGLTERLVQHLGWTGAAAVIERGKLKRESWANSLFKRYFAGLKAEGFCIEYVHELARSQALYQAGRAPAPDADKIAERVAKLINEDFGGLHLKRMGRNPSLQMIARLLLLAPDWTESNYRTITGMLPGLNAAIGKALGEVPPPPGMERHYRAFWGRIFLRMTLATIVAQLLLNGKDDSEEFIREQMLTDQFNRRRWTEVDISKLYRMLGIDLEGQRKTFSLGGHFWDFLRLLDPWRLIKGKASPMARALGAGFSGSDFADRPFTGVQELVTTGRTVKKSAYAPTEGGFDRLPATMVNQVINMQPIQMGQFLRYLQGEEDGLTALLHSAGAHVGTAWRPRTIAPIAALPGAETVAAEITRLGAAGVLAMGPPAKTLTVGGISRSLSRAQYDDYVRRSSQAAAARLQTLITSPGYQAMSDARRAEKVRAIVERARQRARRPIRHELKKAS